MNLKLKKGETKQILARDVFGREARDPEAWMPVDYAGVVGCGFHLHKHPPTEEEAKAAEQEGRPVKPDMLQTFTIQARGPGKAVVELSDGPDTVLLNVEVEGVVPKPGDGEGRTFKHLQG